MEKKDSDNLEKARKVLENLFWGKVWLRSCCYGDKKNTNPFSGDNLIIAMGDELTVISLCVNGKLRIHKFVRITDQPIFMLGDIIKEKLIKADLDIEE